MKKKNIWDRYKSICILGEGSMGKVYKAQNRKTNEYVAIKEIDKSHLKKKIALDSENAIEYKCEIDSGSKVYVVMEYCILNLEEYIQMNEKGLEPKEVKEILLQLNNVFKLMNNQKIIHSKLSLTNILLKIQSLNKIIIKISDLSSIDSINNNSNIELKLSEPPEALENQPYSLKSDIWSLGTIIYYMLFKEYPYNGDGDVLDEIKKGKKFKSCNDKLLNDLISKMLVYNPEKRISWEEYFSDNFFKTEKKKNLNIENNFHQDKINSDNLNDIKKQEKEEDKKKNDFLSICEIHKEKIWGHCKKCKKNICENCIDKHPNNIHEVIPFFNIGFNKKELDEIYPLMQQIKNNITNINLTQKLITGIFENLKINKLNSDIFQYDKKNNFKQYFIDCLKEFETESKVDFLFSLDLNNFIICEHEIKKEDLNKKINILNYPEDYKKDLINCCDIFINNKKIDFSYDYIFSEEGKYEIKIKFKKEINNLSWLFYNCKTITTIYFANFHINNINDISYMFHGCSSLKYLDINHLNVENVINMNGLFSDCYSLENLDLSELESDNVKNMNWMFQNCYSLKNLNLSNFNTSKVEYMIGMFENCNSLESLDLSSFNTSNVIDVSNIFSGCSKLTFLNILYFNLDFCYNMNNMFLNLNSRCTIEQNDRKINLILQFDNLK